jgi:hypothetical protein
MSDVTRDEIEAVCEKVEEMAAILAIVIRRSFVNGEAEADPRALDEDAHRLRFWMENGRNGRYGSSPW